MVFFRAASSVFDVIQPVKGVGLCEEDREGSKYGLEGCQSHTATSTHTHTHTHTHRRLSQTQGRI